MGRPKEDSNALRLAYEELKRQLGRAPTASELSRASGMSYGATRWRMDSLGLERTALDPRERARLGGQKMGKLIEAESPEERTARRCRTLKWSGEADSEDPRRIQLARTMRGRLIAVCLSGDRDKRPECLPRPGEGVEPWTRVHVQCAVCGRGIWVAPRTHPWYVRDAEGRVHWLCGAVCMRSEDGW